MEISYLKQIIRSSITLKSAFSLKTKKLNSSNVDKISADYFPKNTIWLSKATIEEPADNQSIIVRGTGYDLPFSDMDVEIQFYLINSEPALKLKAKGDATWNLSTGFPPLGAIIEKMKFLTSPAPPQLFIYSHDGLDEGRMQGLYFDGVFDLSALTAGLANLINRPTQAISGSITLKEKGSKLYAISLIAPVSKDIDLGIIKAKELKFEIASSLFRSGRLKQYEILPYLSLSINFPFSAQGKSYNLPISASSIDPKSSLNFSLGLTDVIDAGLSELGQLTNQVSFQDILPPTNFNISNLLTLKSFSFNLDFNSKNKISFINLEIVNKTPWNLLTVGNSNKVLSIESLTINFLLLDPLGAKNKLLTIAGEIAVGKKGILEVSAAYPNWYVNGTLKEGTSISITELFQDFLGINADLPEMEIGRLYIEIKSEEYSLDVEIFDVWDFDSIPISLESLFASIKHDSTSTIASFQGTFSIGNVSIGLTADYGGQDIGWEFSGKVSGENISLLGLFTQFLPDSWTNNIPASLKSLYLYYLSASVKTKSKEYSFETKLLWELVDLPGRPTIDASLSIYSNLDANLKRSYSGSVGGTFTLNNLAISITYEFAEKANEIIFRIDFRNSKGIVCKLETVGKDKLLQVSVGNLSFGDIVEFLVNLAIPGRNFELSGFWTLLNDISFSNLTLNINLTKKTVGIEYRVDTNFELVYIDTLTLTQVKRNGENTVDIAITGKFLEQEYGKANPLKWDLLNDEPPITKPNDILLDIEYLGLGQHVSLDTKSISTISQAIAKLEDAIVPPSKDTVQNPIGQSSSVTFNKDSHWLIGAKLSLMNTVSLAVVFNDPEIYGLYIALSGPKAGSFSGLSFEILYKKITDSIGLYHIELQIPTAMRTLQLGAISLTLPIITVDIYTNGNFRVDLGFPKNGDFSRSFCMQMFPFIGYGGFYFALLTGETSQKVPKITNGSFSPVIEFGIGLSLGVGKTIEAGPLKAGASLSVLGILEGVLAWFEPNEGEDVSSEMYYRIQGTIGILGQVYGTVDFYVIKVDFSIIIYAAATLVIESHQPIQISLTARVSVSASIKVLFVRIHFSFSMSLDLSFTIGSKTTPPWRLDSSSTARRMMAARLGSSAGANLTENGAWAATLVLDAKENISLQLLPAFTIAKNGSDNGLSCVALLLVSNNIDNTNSTKISDFDLLVKAMFYWAIKTYYPTSSTITGPQLKNIYTQLTNPEMVFTTFSYNNLSKFLAANFTFKISSPISGATQNSTVFPMLPALAFTNFENIDIDFNNYCVVNDDYEQQLSLYFQQLTTDHKYYIAKDPLGDETSDNFSTISMGDGLESIASLVFKDYFWMIAKSIIQNAMDLLKDSTSAININSLWTSIADQRKPDDIAAMVSRYFLHGVRIPEPTSITIDKNTKWLALYEATGQQFILPNDDKDHSLTFANKEQANWLEFVDETDKIISELVLSLPKSLKDEYPSLPKNVVGLSTNLDWQDQKKLLQVSSLEQLPQFQYSPTKYTLDKKLNWQSAQVPNVVNDATTAFNLWLLPDSLTSKLVSQGNDYKVFKEQDSQITQLDFYQWVTLLKLSISRIKGETSILTNTYLINSLDEASQELLSKLLLSNIVDSSEIYLLYSLTGDDTAKALLNNSLNAAQTFILETNLANNTTGKYSGLISDTREFLSSVWQSSLVNTGGFYLNYATDSNNGLPEDLFKQGDNVNLFLLIIPKSRVNLASYHNSALLKANLEANTIFVESEGDQTLLATMPPGNIGFGLTRPRLDNENALSSDDKLRALYSLLGYQISENQYFIGSNEGLPIGPTYYDKTSEQSAPTYFNIDPNVWSYYGTVPIAKFANPKNSLANLGTPYAGILDKANVELTLTFQDVYGNRLAVNELSLNVPVTYGDQIIGLAQWPGATSGYKFDALNNQPQLSLQIALQLDKYIPTSGNTYENALRTASAHYLRYQQTYYQLVAKDMSAYLVTSLDQKPSITGDKTKYQINKQPLIDFVVSTYIFLDNIQKLKETGEELNTPLVNFASTDIEALSAYYIAQESETLTSIATRYNISVYKLAERNSQLRAIFLPEKSITLSNIAITTEITDNLETLCVKFINKGVSCNITSLVDVIKDVIGLIRPNAIIVTPLPILSTPSSLLAEANKFKVSVLDLARANSAFSDIWQLQVNTVVRVQNNSLALNQNDSLLTLVERFQNTFKIKTSLEELILANQNIILFQPNKVFMLPPISLSVQTQIHPNYPATIFPVTVALQLVRSKELTDQHFASENLFQNESLVVPQIAGDFSDTLSLREFAKSFESAFSNALKLGIGEEKGKKELWAVNFGVNGINKLEVVNNKPNFFALKPLSNQLVSQTGIQIKQYSQGVLSQDTQQQNFSNIDMDAWLKEFLAAVDWLLTPEMATAFYQKDANNYQLLLQTKAQLAQALKLGVDYILDDTEKNTQALSSAQETLYQQLLTNLSNAYTVDVLLQYPIKSNSPFIDSTISPRLNGKPVANTYRTSTQDSLSSIASYFQISPEYLVGVIADISKILAPNVTIKYLEKTDITITSESTTLRNLADTWSISLSELALGLEVKSGLSLFAPNRLINICGVSKTVSQGDTFDSIADYFNIDIYQLALAAQFQLSILQTGSYKIANQQVSITLQDNLSILTRKLNISLTSLADAIEDRSDILLVGGVFRIAQLLPAYSLSTGKTSLVDNSHLTFLFNTNLDSQYKNLFLNLNYVINELEYNISGNSNSYQLSDWLSFIVPIGTEDDHSTVKSNLGQVDLPIPLRAYPGVPILTYESSKASNPEAITVEDTKFWDYSFTVVNSTAAQDTHYLDVSFNDLETSDNNDFRQVDINLFTALAQFNSIYASIKLDIQNLFQKKATDVLVLKTFVEMVQQVSNSINNYYANLTIKQASKNVEGCLYRLEYILDETEQYLSSLNLSLLDKSANGLTLWPNIYVNTLTGPIKLTTSNTDSKEKIYRYPDRVSITNSLTHSYVFPKLDITQTQNAWCGLYVKRNEELIHARVTNSAFIYQTPLVQFFNRIIPLVEAYQEISINYQSDLEACLNLMLRKLFSTGAAKNYPISLSCSYGYALVTKLAIAGTSFSANDSNTLSSLLPVFLRPRFVYDSSKPNELANILSKVVTEWQRQNPASKSHGFYQFELTLYSSLEETQVQPLLQLKRLNYLVD